jgi:hypothetical protein
VRLEGESDAIADARDENEADVVVAGVNDYVKETDPDNLTAAEAELDAWEIPGDPLDEELDIPEGTPLSAVFSASSEAEANIVRGVLQSAGIPSTFDNSTSMAIPTVLDIDDGAWSRILVPETMADAARAAISEAVSSDSPAD